MMVALDFAAGNLIPIDPILLLEMRNLSDCDLESEFVPAGVCSCIESPLQCFDVKSGVGCDCGFVPIHACNLTKGLLGVEFGVTQTGTDIFLGAFACPGFTKGPSNAGEPAAIIFWSTGPCYGSATHPGFTKWLSTGPSQNIFRIVPNADVGNYKVFNCDNEYYEWPMLGGNAQWGAPQTIGCRDAQTGIELVTWGRIKGLYR
jgi:hypothetical protein